MTYEILDHDCLVMADRIRSEQGAIKRIIETMSTLQRPKFVRRSDGEIIALIYCDVLYRPVAAEAVSA